MNRIATHDELAALTVEICGARSAIEFEIASVVISDPKPGIECLASCGIDADAIADDDFKVWLGAARLLSDRHRFTGDIFVDRGRWFDLMHGFYRAAPGRWAEDDFARQWTGENRLRKIAGGAGPFTDSLLRCACTWWNPQGSTVLQPRVIRLLARTLGELHARQRDAGEHLGFVRALLTPPRIIGGVIVEGDTYTLEAGR